MSSITGHDLEKWRRARGWDKAETARRLRGAANGSPVAGHKVLARMIASWERGDHAVSERYELLYRALGFPGVPADAADVAWLAGRTRFDRRLVLIDIVLSVIVAGLGIGLTLALVSDSSDTAAAHRASNQALAAAQKATDVQREYAGWVEKICTTFAHLPVPPPGDPATNPSRAALSGVIGTLHGLGDDVGCHRVS
jgi:hypothetical protein